MFFYRLTDFILFGKIMIIFSNPAISKVKGWMLRIQKTLGIVLRFNSFTI